MLLWMSISNNLKAHPHVLINTKEKNNAANCIEKLNILTVSTAIFTKYCNICWFALHETL